MENLRRFVNVAKTPTSCSSTFYNSSLSEELSQYCQNDCDKSKYMITTGLSELQQIYTDCSAYAEDLNCLCKSGLRVANCLASVDANLCADSSSTHEMAGHFVKVWNQLTVTTNKLVSELEDGPLVALRDAIATEKKDKSMADNKKLLMACLVAILQIHFQFSFSMFESVVQLFVSFPKDVTPSTTDSKSPVNNPVDLSTHLITSWVESMTEMQKYLANSLANFHHLKFTNELCHPCFVNGSHNSQTARRRWSFGGLRQTCMSNDWTHKQWPTSTAQRCDVDNVWLNESLRAEEQIKQTAFEAKTNVTSSQKNGTFASNEELQDVISLLSCQPSNPSSPASEVPHSLTGSTNGGQNLLWSSSPQSVSHSSAFSNNSMESNALTPDVEDYSSWNKNGDQPFGDLSLGLQPKLFDLNNLTSQGNLSSDIQHPKAIKTTSCPSSHQQSEPKNSNGENNDAVLSGTRSKEQGFFLGLELVGTDLMASVRQRRHSSGESLCKNSRVNSPSSSCRTKSIDNIMSDGKCTRTCTWPLKQVSPQSSVFYFQNNDWKSAEQHPEFNNWSSQQEYPLGLPPSGIECRSKNKMERKYSLFGNPT